MMDRRSLSPTTYRVSAALSFAAPGLGQLVLDQTASGILQLLLSSVVTLCGIFVIDARSYAGHRGESVRYIIELVPRGCHTREDVAIWVSLFVILLTLRAVSAALCFPTPSNSKAGA